MGQIASLVLTSLMLGTTYSLIAYGFSLIFGIAGIINFSHGEFYMVGAMFTYYLISVWGLPPPLGIVSATIIVAIIGAVLSYTLYRPIRPSGPGLQHAFPPMILSLGLGAIVPALVILLTGTESKGVSSYVSGILKFGGVIFSVERLFTMLLGLAIFFALLLFIWKNREGRALSALSQNIESAKLNGVNLTKSDMIGFALGFGLAALSAAILAPLFYIDSTLGSAVFLKTFIIVILGGLGSVPGTLIGGLIVGFIDGFGQAYLPGGTAELLSFLLVIVILSIKPQGIFGKDI